MDGNYWNKYSGDYADGDGIGDIPHVFREVNQDNYQDNNPLMVAVDINAIPEFSLWAVLPLIGAIMLVVLICRKKL
ncbi:MAG: hypothetical protein IAX21_09940 [Candidatus Bathyarchaeota archaeon]|nr:MAG: hypothetical protein IAX21_09940 [Candidatus Bathyarchaeota archaeon]